MKNDPTGATGEALPAAAPATYRWEHQYPAEAQRIRTMDTGDLVIASAAFGRAINSLIDIINQPRCDNESAAYRWINGEQDRLGAVREMIMEELRKRPSTGDFASEQSIRAVIAYDVFECGEGFLEALGTMARMAAEHETVRNDIKHGRAA